VSDLEVNFNHTGKEMSVHQRKTAYDRCLGVLFAAALLLSAGTAMAQSVISPVPGDIVAKYNLDTRWYTKYIDAWGVPVLGSGNLEDATLLRARSQLGTLLWTYPYWPVPALNTRKVRVVLVARSERMSSIPEVYAAYGTSLDERYWAGMGATASLPLSVGTEANLMDNYGSENVFAHEFGHTVMEMALAYIDPNFSSQLNTAYTAAMRRNLWRNTYASSDQKEYWAEGLQSYFNVNREGPPGGDGVHNNVNTRAELVNYDRPLYDLLNRVYRDKNLP
jgi:hypothetical protein